MQYKGKRGTFLSGDKRGFIQKAVRGGGLVAVWVYNWRVYKPGWIGDPGAPLTNFNDGGGVGGPTEVHILCPKNHNFRICLPKKITTFLAYPVPQKIP